jgi:hypothetical protein
MDIGGVGGGSSPLMQAAMAASPSDSGGSVGLTKKALNMEQAMMGKMLEGLPVAGPPGTNVDIRI